MQRFRLTSRLCVRPQLSRRFAGGRFFSNSTDAAAEEERVSDDFDVVIVGGGPSGLSAAIRLKQLSVERGKDLRVCVVEKAAEFGGHTLSGAVIETRALDELIPDWKDKGAPLKQEAKEDSFVYLTRTGSIKFPIAPPQMNNHGNYIVRLGHVVRWLSTQAEEAGVELYPSIAAASLLHDDSGAVQGIRTHDVGIGKDGKKKSSYQPGMDLRARLTIMAEGCRGHLTRRLEQKFNLRAESSHQTYGIGLKELWEVKPEVHRPGFIQHTIGWPAPSDLYGGSFLYHLLDEGKPLVSLGYVVALDYTNPYLNPYMMFQNFKHHPIVSSVLEGGTCLQYGARTISEGGYQSIPRLYFPGGVLIGDTAGFLNVPKIKGTHTAIKSGMLAAESAFEELTKEDQKGPIVLKSYEERLRGSWLSKELYRERNIRPYFHFGLFPALALSAVDTFVFRGHAPWTLKHGKPDHAATKKASESKPIDYIKPDGKISFDLLTNLQRSGTNHEEDQPVHLTLKDATVPTKINLPEFAGPEQRYCPAGVYEFIDNPSSPGQKQLVRNAQNCIHCKTCDIKDITQNIVWVNPEGGGGPNYNGM